MGVIFVASNGMEIARKESGRLSVGESTREGFVRVHVGGETVDALFEYWQHVQDKKLGRIRDKVNPRFVWYPQSDYGVRILDEVDCLLHHAWKGLESGGAASDFRDSVQRYFENLPREPWEDAEEGDIWVLTGAGGLEQAWQRSDGAWCKAVEGYKVAKYDAVYAIAGRRIWPEGEASE